MLMVVTPAVWIYFFDVLYGITLHGDPDRIQRLARWPITAQCLALYESNVERRKGVVTVRQYIDLAIKDGQIGRAHV